MRFDPGTVPTPIPASRTFSSETDHAGEVSATTAGIGRIAERLCRLARTTSISRTSQVAIMANRLKAFGQTRMLRDCTSGTVGMRASGN